MFDQLKQLSQLGPLMARAREMQSKMADAQARLPALRATGTAGGELVTAVASGKLEIVALTFSPQAPQADPELLDDLTRAAGNQALSKAQELITAQMEEVLGGMDLGGMDLGGMQGLLGDADV